MAVCRALTRLAIACAVGIVIDAHFGVLSAQSIIEALQNGIVIRVQHTDCRVGGQQGAITLTGAAAPQVAAR